MWVELLPFIIPSQMNRDASFEKTTLLWDIYLFKWFMPCHSTNGCQGGLRLKKSNTQISQSNIAKSEGRKTIYILLKCIFRLIPISLVFLPFDLHSSRKSFYPENQWNWQEDKWSCCLEATQFCGCRSSPQPWGLLLLAAESQETKEPMNITNGSYLTYGSYLLGHSGWAVMHNFLAVNEAHLFLQLKKKPTPHKLSFTESTIRTWS